MKPAPKSKRQTHHHWFTIIGTLLVLLSFYYIGLQLWGYREDLQAWTPTSASFIAIGFCIIIYALANYLLAAAWVRQLRICGEITLDWRVLLPIYGKSQIAKYIPGNIAHIAGRHAMGKFAGIAHSHLVIAALYEIIGLVCAALIITLIGGSSVINQFTSLSWSVAALPIILISYLISPRLLQLFRPDMESVSPLMMLPPLIYYAFFFLASGTALVIVGIYTGSFTLKPDNLIILSAFAVAWAVGFLTPGAPSGIGIREAILVLLLSPFTGEGNSLIMAFLFRLVTIGGDIVFYFSSIVTSGTNAHPT
jgi:uncharacterized membrane protein YbhN (UPF0104 family)